MTGAGASAGSDGERLLAAGWRQGSMFTGKGLRYLYNGRDGATCHRQVKESEKLVLISQECDILTAREPYVEAMLCRQQNGRAYLARVAQNSARVFVIDLSPESDPAWVVEAKYRLQLEKGVLHALAPEPWPGTPKRLEQFVRWLARRYDRPALPDALVESFQKPVEQALRRLYDEQPAMGRAFSQAVREVRVSLPPAEQPPFHLQVILLLHGGDITAEEANAIGAAEQAIRNALDPARVRLEGGVRTLDEEQMSVAEYFATRPLFLEYLTYRGDETEGAEPPPRA
jgi:hypothetical protein